MPKPPSAPSHKCPRQNDQSEEKALVRQIHKFHYRAGVAAISRVGRVEVLLNVYFVCGEQWYCWPIVIQRRTILP